MNLPNPVLQLSQIWQFPASVRYPAADGYYAGNKSADGITGAGYHLISELRHDAYLRCLYAGGQKPEGRPEMSDGKVRSEFVSETDNVSLHTAVVNSPSLKRNIRIVYGCHSRLSVAPK